MNNHYGLKASDVRLLRTDSAEQLAIYSVKDTLQANWSGPRARGDTLPELPAVGSRVLVNFSGWGLGTVTGYFFEDGWIGCEVKVDKIPREFAARKHSGLGHFFGLELNQTPAA